MRMYDIINDKRNNRELSKEQIGFWIKGVTDESIPDYQSAALLMAICINNMNPSEACNLTLAMADSGDRADLSGIKGIIVDKHSSGGVGDKCTLIVGPIVSSFNIPFAKLSGRGLGHTGGTIDKLESIEGLRTDFSLTEFIDLVNRTGMVVSAQTASLAPADKKLYALRDVTATVESIPLIAASIMSKKIASGAGNILLDVKCGNGAFMEDIAKADELAKLMSDVGKLAGRNIKVFVTNMDQPLGNYIGNALEVKEAYDTLDGKGPKDLTDLCVMLSAGMMELAGIGSYEDCVVKAYESIENKIALLQFRKALEAQGGKFDESGYPVLHNKAIYTRDVFAQSDGFISNMDTKAIGMASLVLGAGRARKEDIIDPGAGIILYKKIPDSVKAGDRIAALFTNKEASLEEAESIMKKSIHIGTAQADELKLVLEVID